MLRSRCRLSTRAVGVPSEWRAGLQLPACRPRHRRSGMAPLGFPEASDRGRRTAPRSAGCSRTNPSPRLRWPVGALGRPSRSPLGSQPTGGDEDLPAAWPGRRPWKTQVGHDHAVAGHSAPSGPTDRSHSVRYRTDSGLTSCHRGWQGNEGLVGLEGRPGTRTANAEGRR
jgi:hypothetical protein